MNPADYEAPDLREKGASDQRSEKRLYMQLQVFTASQTDTNVVEAVKSSGLDAVVYVDANDPQGLGVLLMSEDPGTFVEKGRALYSSEAFRELRRRPGMTMIGRTYGIGREPNIDFALVDKPKKNALNPEWPWAIWYPLRRKPEFSVLPPRDQGKILSEHAFIGMAWGKADYAHDIRLACHGLDREDNEFVIGLVGKELAPLSRLIQEMRKTEQTSKWIQSLGPFFVGRAIYQS